MSNAATILLKENGLYIAVANSEDQCVAAFGI